MDIRPSQHRWLLRTGFQVSALRLAAPPHNQMWSPCISHLTGITAGRTSAEIPSLSFSLPPPFCKQKLKNYLKKFFKNTSASKPPAPMNATFLEKGAFTDVVTFRIPRGHAPGPSGWVWAARTPMAGVRVRETQGEETATGAGSRDQSDAAASQGMEPPEAGRGGRVLPRSRQRACSPADIF